MSPSQAARPAGEPDLLTLYDEALPHVYGYLVSRCGERALAEDLAADTFLAAVDAVRTNKAPPLTTPWLIGVARHKLADHWRRQARDASRLRRLTVEVDQTVDPWGKRIDAIVARSTLDALASQHRMVLTLRYVDDLPVADVAEAIGRTVHATEALLVRARSAFRGRYPVVRHTDREEGHHG